MARARVSIFATLLASLAVVSGVCVSSAQARSRIYSFSTTPLNTAAGAHPDLGTSIHFGSRRNSEEFGYEKWPECFCNDAKNITIHLPAGVIGNPNNVPRCTRADFAGGGTFIGLNCNPDSQVGYARVTVLYENSFFEAVYNLEPNPNQAGLLGFYLPLAEAPAFIVLSARTGGDYGLNAEFNGIEQAIPPERFMLNLWGVPADPSHDIERFPLGGRFCQTFPCFTPRPSNAELLPFLDNPTTCGGPLASSAEVLAYDHLTTFAESTWPAVTGCDQLTFNPSLYAQPTTTETDSASGLDTDLSVPQVQSPSAPSPSEIRATTVTLPKGMSINPNAADGKTACANLEARLGTDEEAECPEFAKVGTLSLTSTALPGPLPGFVYVGQPEAGNRYRIILAANGFATHVKIVGTVEPDPQTGQLVVSFKDLPQAPFSDFNLHFFGSERGFLATPTQCGTYPVVSTFTPWDASLPEQTSTQYFTLDKGPNGGACPGSPRQFRPTVGVGVTDATAATHSPLSLDLTRPDGDQNLAGLTVSTPPGFSAALKGIPYCSDAALAAAANSGYSGTAEQANPSCPVASQIGEATAGAGAGSHPVYLQGKVYLAGPYKGAPLSLAVVTPAVSGPYDLGVVVVRVALHLDSTTAQVTAVSDPLPQIVEGIPLRLRSILVNLDRPGFALNPTNCDPFSIDSDVFGDEGSAVTLREHFQVANCRGLPFAPKLSLKLTGGVRRLGHPAIHALLRAAPGEANIHSIAVTLPEGGLLDNAHIGNVCTKVAFAADHCPADSVLGSAEATTPLLDQPLTGTAYLRSSSRGLPDVAIALKGQVDVDLIGHVGSVAGRLGAAFATVPDVPVSSFALNLAGGSKGLIRNSESLCGHSKAATARIEGQNGRVIHRDVPLQTSCGKSARKHRHKRHHRAKVGG